MKRPILVSASVAVFAFAAPQLAAQDSGEQTTLDNAQEQEETVELDAMEQSQGEVFEFKTIEEEEAEALEQELSQAFALYGELFKIDPLTEEQEARLPLAQRMSEHMLPEGALGEMMEEMMGSMFTTMVELITSDQRGALAGLTGMELDELDQLDDDSVEEALALLDPDFAPRNERMIVLLTGLFGELFNTLEPAYREAMTHTLAVRFEEAEMVELLAFFETPLGGKFARESFRLQYDPQMAGAMEALGPAMAQWLPRMVEEVEGLEKEFTPARDFTELGQTERERLASLLGKGEAELEALAPVAEEEFEEDEDLVI